MWKCDIPIPFEKDTPHVLKFFFHISLFEVTKHHGLGLSRRTVSFFFFLAFFSSFRKRKYMK